jgi:hypothetical protein
MIFQPFRVPVLCTALADAQQQFENGIIRRPMCRFAS